MYFFICNFALSSSHASLVKGIDVIGILITKKYSKMCVFTIFQHKIDSIQIEIKKNAKRMDENIY